MSADLLTLKEDGHTVGAGLHLLPPNKSEAVVHESVHLVTENPYSDQPLADPSDHAANSPLAAGESPAIDNQGAPPSRDLASIPAIEVTTRAIVMLMSAAAEKLGLSDPVPADSPHLDLDEARRLITSLAGLVDASGEYLGIHAAPIRDGLQSLQKAFKEASAFPDAPGQGPGEKYTGPVY